MAIRVRQTSRLRFSTLRQVEGIQFFDSPELPAIEPALDDQTYVVEDNDRIDLLANTFYGTPQLWWVLAKANNFQLLPRDMRVGMVLRVPSRQRVVSKILQPRV